jgi:hypothetical protein
MLARQSLKRVFVTYRKMPSKTYEMWPTAACVHTEMSTRTKAKGPTSLRLDYIRVMKFDHVESSQSCLSRREGESTQRHLACIYEVLEFIVEENGWHTK